MKKPQKNKLDRLFQQTIVKRDGKCQICSKEARLNAHHIYSRARMNTRWDLENGIALCVGCHTFSSTLSAHKTPRAFFRWLEQRKGKKWVDDLEIRSDMIAQNLDYNLLKIYLEQELKKYE